MSKGGKVGATGTPVRRSKRRGRRVLCATGHSALYKLSLSCTAQGTPADYRVKRKEEPCFSEGREPATGGTVTSPLRLYYK